MSCNPSCLPPATVQLSDLQAAPPSEHPDKCLDPAFPMLSPGELLRKYNDKQENEVDKMDLKGVWRNQLDTLLNIPGGVGAPIGLRTTIREAQWALNPANLWALPVPVNISYSTTIFERPQFEIVFKDPNPEGPSTGIHVGKLYGSACSSKLEGAHDIVLSEFQGRILSFIIAWPGYERQQFKIRVASTKDGPLTRFELAQQIMITYAKFFRKIESDKIAPYQASQLNIALQQGQNRRSDSYGVQFAELHLVRCRSTVGGHVVADVEVVCIC